MQHAFIIAGVKIYTHICNANNHFMPTIFEIFGLRFFFFSGDHAPIHVHVVKGDDEAKIACEAWNNYFDENE